MLVILSDRRESKDPEGDCPTSVAQTLFYLDCKLARSPRLEMDARPSPVQAFSGFFDSLRSLRMTMDKRVQMQRVRTSNIHTNPSLSMGQRLVRNARMWVTERL